MFQLILRILGVVLLSGVSAVLYRIGGAAKDGGVLDPFKNTKVRDWGTPLVALTSLLLIVSAPWWVYLLSFGLMFASMVSYYKWFGRLFGYDDGDVHWPSWALVGFLFSFSSILFAFQGYWLGFTIRTIFLTVSICLWSHFIKIDWLDEGGRGFLFNFSLLLFLL